MLWGSVYGWHSTPPSPGPNPSPMEAVRATGALAVFKAGGDVRKWLLQTTNDVVGDDIGAAITFARAERRLQRQPPVVSTLAGPQ